MRLFTREELSKYDGSGGNPSYIAYEGKVYDVSSAPNWIDGSHFEHYAADDLTGAINDAPHGDDVMDAFPIIGELSR
jgi:predicted heme/steroid binding protein